MPSIDSNSKMLYVHNQRLKDTIRAFYMSLVNDIQFVQRLRSMEEDYESYNYLCEKLKLEVEGPALSLDL